MGGKDRAVCENRLYHYAGADLSESGFYRNGSSVLSVCSHQCGIYKRRGCERADRCQVFEGIGYGYSRKEWQWIQQSADCAGAAYRWKDGRWTDEGYSEWCEAVWGKDSVGHWNPYDYRG